MIKKKSDKLISWPTALGYCAPPNQDELAILESLYKDAHGSAQGTFAEVFRHRYRDGLDHIHRLERDGLITQEHKDNEEYYAVLPFLLVQLTAPKSDGTLDALDDIYDFLRHSYEREFNREIPLREIYRHAGMDKERFAKLFAWLRRVALFRHAPILLEDLDQTTRLHEAIGTANSAREYFSNWCERHLQQPKPARTNDAVRTRHEVRREALLGAALALMATQRDKCWDADKKQFTAQKIYQAMELNVVALFGEDADLPLGDRRAIDQLNLWLKKLSPHKI